MTDWNNGARIDWRLGMTEDYTKEEYEEILGVAGKEEKVEWVPAQDWYKNPDDFLYKLVTSLETTSKA